MYFQNCYTVHEIGNIYISIYVILGYKLLNDTTNAGLTPLDLTSDERMVEVLLKHKRESWQAEKKWISEMDSNIKQTKKPSLNFSFFNLNVLQLHAQIETTCLVNITQRLRNRRGTERKTKDLMVPNIDYLEYSHNLEAFKVFLKYANDRLKGKISVPETLLIAFVS